MGAKEPSRFDIQVSAGLFHILDSPIRPAPEFLRNQTARHADTLSKLVSKEEVAQALEQMGLVSTIRGEKLSLQEFAQLSDLLKEGKN